MLLLFCWFFLSIGYWTIAVGDGVCTGLGDWLPQVRGDLLLLDLECEDVVLEADEPNVKNDTGVETFLCFVDEGEFSCEAVDTERSWNELEMKLT